MENIIDLILNLPWFGQIFASAIAIFLFFIRKNIFSFLESLLSKIENIFSFKKRREEKKRVVRERIEQEITERIEKEITERIEKEITERTERIEKESEENFEDDNLEDHKLFTDCARLKHKINMIHLGNVEKTELFKSLLIIKYDVVRKHALILINNKNIYEISNNQIYAMMLKNMTEIINEYNEKLKYEFGEDIYNLVMMHPVHGFNVVHEGTIEYIQYGIEDATTPDHRTIISTKDKLDFLLDMYYIAIKRAISDVNKIFRHFNGDLDILLKKKN